MKRIALLIAVMVAFLPVQMTAQNTFRQGSPVTKEMIEAPDSPTLLIFSASWCGPCHRMRENIFPLEEVSELLQKYNLLFLDVDTQQGYDIQRYYCSQAVVPYYIILDKELNYVTEQIGASDAKTFCVFLRKGLPENADAPKVTTAQTLDALTSSNYSDALNLSVKKFTWSFGAEGGVNSKTGDNGSFGAQAGLFARSDSRNIQFEAGLNLTINNFFYLGIPVDCYIKFFKRVKAGLGFAPQFNLGTTGNSFDITGRANLALDLNRYTVKFGYNAGFVNQNKGDILDRQHNNFLSLSFGIILL